MIKIVKQIFPIKILKIFKIYIFLIIVINVKYKLHFEAIINLIFKLNFEENKQIKMYRYQIIYFIHKIIGTTR